MKGMRSSSLRKWILGRLLRKSVRKAALSDFEERFIQISEAKGKAASFLWYGFQIIGLLPPAIKDSASWSLIMFENYFKSAFRHIKKQKGYSLITLAGLTIGITCFALIKCNIYNTNAETKIS